MCKIFKFYGEIFAFKRCETFYPAHIMEMMLENLTFELNEKPYMIFWKLFTVNNIERGAWIKFKAVNNPYYSKFNQNIMTLVLCCSHLMLKIFLLDVFQKKTYLHQYLAAILQQKPFVKSARHCPILANGAMNELEIQLFVNCCHQENFLLHFHRHRRIDRMVCL